MVRSKSWSETCSRLALRIGVFLLTAASPLIAAPPADKPAQPQPANPTTTAPNFERQIAPLLKARCVKCHGPIKAESQLNLSTAVGVARGGKSGPAVTAHDLAAGSLWEKIDGDEMPPDMPLTADEKELLRGWIIAGAPGLPAPEALKHDAGEHWAFQPLAPVPLPEVQATDRVRTSVDRFILQKLEAAGLALQPEAERRVLIRRVSFTLTGLPPTLSEVQTYLQDQQPGAYERMVERYLASPHYGERWGKYWLDAVGYADSNGYFNADSDRPLAYRYRDYVVRAINQDRPFNRFLLEQIAGDELARAEPDRPVTSEIVEFFEATHFLRNGHDGTSESDGNPDELRLDRYSALEACQQNMSTALLGLTLQCAKCHDHKFEPITQRDYFQFQAVLYPAFPAAHGDHWVKPKDRFTYAAPPAEVQAWEQQVAAAEQESKRLTDELRQFVRERQPRGEILFSETGADDQLAARWSNTAPGDDAPAGDVPVALTGEAAPRARIREGALDLIEGTAPGDRWLCTQSKFDWTPDERGAVVQVTFDLLANQVEEQGSPAERIGYLIAVHDFHDNNQVANGNILIDGNPNSETTIYHDYPGEDGTRTQVIGSTGYQPGHNYGVRITNIGKKKFRLEQVVDGLPEKPFVDLTAEDLPDGGFAFEFCCGRSFRVDNVLVERWGPVPQDAADPRQQFETELEQRQKATEAVTKRHRELAGNRPGQIAWMTDTSTRPPETHLLRRGNYAEPGEVVTPGIFSCLTAPGEQLTISSPGEKAQTTGRRLAWVNWATRPESRPAGLLARVQVNRWWQHHFGTGIVATSENLGVSGATPSHPELLNWLAHEFIARGWSQKEVHRLIVNSATFRQQSTVADPQRADEVDPQNQWLHHFPVRRLDAEALRDALLTVSGELDRATGGAYIPSRRNDSGETEIPEDHPGAKRRSLYLQQRRTQVVSLLQVFDTPSIVFNSVRRPSTTMPLQSLALLNSEFIRRRASAWATQLEAATTAEPERLQLAFQAAYLRAPTSEEQEAARGFLEAQTQEYAAQSDARHRAWIDLCHMLLASNEFLYVE